MADYPRVTHPCAAPTTEYCYPVISARLACLIHAASVRSEPESNSPLKNVSWSVCPVVNRTIYNLKTLQNIPTNRITLKGLLTYRTFQFSMSSRCFHPKILQALLASDYPSQAPIFLEPLSRIPPVWFGTGFPIRGTKSPRADSIFFTRPLRP